VYVVRSIELVAGALADLARPGDLVITLGAGSIGGVAQRFVAELERRQGRQETVH
jgi:UDP-N-acetylmuramate-alanine ligase